MASTTSIDPKHVLILGAGPGLSASIARRFAREGFAVTLLSRGGQDLAELADELRAGRLRHARRDTRSIQGPRSAGRARGRSTRGRPRCRCADVLHPAHHPARRGHGHAPAAHVAKDAAGGSARGYSLLPAPDARQTQIVPELAPTEQEAVIDKTAMSAFAGTRLEHALRSCDINAVALVGVATE